MDNRKLFAGILTIVAAGVAISLVLSTKKGRQAGKNLLKKGNRITDVLKGKFNEFVDQVQEKVQGVR